VSERLSLACLTTGQKAKISGMPTHAETLRKLMVFGLLPGGEVEVLQHSPSYVLAVGNTYLALDQDIAKLIFVVLC